MAKKTYVYKIDEWCNEIISEALIVLVKKTNMPQTKNDALRMILKEYADKNRMVSTYYPFNRT